MKLKDCGPKVGMKDIENLESLLGAKISPAYREFLLTQNGGTPAQNIEVFVPNAQEMPTDVQLFFSLGDRIESCDLIWNLSLNQDMHPNWHALPIATDSGGNNFCLIVDDGIADAVVYCDSEKLTFHPVAKNFNDFLAALQPL